MTTTVVNNLVFRAFFEKQKLSRPNFIDCYKQLRIVLLAEDKLNYLELPIPGTLVPTLLDNQFLLKLLQLTLHGLKDKRKLLGNNKGKGNSKLDYAPNPKIPPPPKKEDPAKDSVCHHRGDTCHWKRNCPQYLSEFLKNKKLPQGAMEALNKRDTLTKPDKLEPRSIKCIFVGYPKETMGYSFYYPPENKALVAQNAEFLDNSLITQEASGSLEDLEIIQEEDKHPFINTSSHHEEDDLEIDEPQSDIIPIRRSTRARNALNRMCLYVDAEEHELRDLGQPANYKAALLDHESDKWLNAMNVEMQSMKDNEVWDLADLPPNGKTIGRKWLFKRKTDMDGAVHTYKAHLVAKGFTQTYGVDYEETFSPIADIRTIRILIAIAAYYGKWMSKLPSSMDISQKRVSCYTDVGYLTNADDLKSQTGYVFILNGGVVDWKSTKQIIFAISSAEAEYIAAYNASKEAVWVRNFISRLGVVPIIEEPIKMYCDNTGAITIANESGINKGARHFRAKVHYICEVIEYGDVKLENVHTDDNLDDPFTKALAFLKHSEHTKNIGMLPASSLM
ncbi:retrotransposon protein, putative, ty1-copia subclass [Tanacetum coccineum]